MTFYGLIRSSGSIIACDTRVVTLLDDVIQKRDALSTENMIAHGFYEDDLSMYIINIKVSSRGAQLRYISCAISKHYQR